MTTDALRSVQTGVQFSVLGPLTVTEGTATLNIGGPKQRTVLAILISRAGSPVSADLLVDAVYGEEAGPRSRRTIQTFVSTLRGEVGEVIEKTGGGWRFGVDPELIDARLFENLVGSAAEVVEKTPERAAQLLREALALWNGHPYSDVEAHGHLDGEVSRLNALRLSAHSSRIDADLAAGRHGDLVGEIEALLVEHPYQEHFRAQHMVALYRAGRQQEALASYRQMRALLADELGIDPSAELQDLEFRILEQDPSLHETTTTTIQRKAILVADPGDPLEIARLDVSERDSVVARAAEVVDGAVGAHPGVIVHSAGTATYALFDDISSAASAAETVVLRLDGEGLRMAIDWGDVEVSDDGVTGPPVTRAARLVGVAHRGQVLLTAEAQQSLSAGGGPGLRFETLGSHTLPGLENTTAIYQLLVGDPPRKFSGLATDRLPPPLPGAGHRSVPGYELRKPIGRGSIGDLYTAYQPSVGRQVLIEVIPRSIAASPDFIRRFEADVQRLWLLDHPNINSIVDYWRDPEGAFVVYRWHRGGLLDLTDAVRREELVAQIGSALAYAHSYGLVHGTVAPDRILLDESGNGFLLGFPFASMPGPTGDYPEYIAPEALEGPSPSVSSDVYALGMLALELEQGSRVDTDTAVLTDDPVLSRALSDDPANRFASIGEFLAEFAPRRSDAPGARYTETRNPYKGLAAFHESDAPDFFGRTELTAQLVERLSDQSFLAVVGPSGSGKSSVVRAGLIPAVRQGRIPGSESWLVTDLLPGSHPFLELRRALERVAVDMPADVMNALASEAPSALSDIRSVLPDGASLLLLVDQFEELFTLVPEETRSRFIDLLSTAVGQGHARVVVTLRADFLDRPLAYSELAELFDRRMVTVGSPTESELRDAIVRPASSIGVEIAPDLVERMVHEVHDRPGALPLLQHTLSELFADRETDLIAVDAYQSIGGVSGSLGNRAESSYQALDDDQRTAAKQLFLRLVTITDESAPTRRRVPVTSLSDLDGDPAMSGFISARLLVVDSDPDTRTPTVEVAHEALLTHWPRLSGWIESAREDLTLARRLEESMHEWDRSGRDVAYLLTGARLAQHRTWTSSSSLKLSDDETEYLQLSAERDQKQRAQRRRRRNWITGGFAAAAVVALVFGVFALQNAQEAEAAAQLAKARELAASSIGVLDTYPELATLLALEAFDVAPTGAGLFPEAMIALREAIDANRLIARIPAESARDVQFTSDGTGLLVVDSGARSIVRYPVVGGDVGLEPVWVEEDTTTNDTYFFMAVSPVDDVAAVLVRDDPYGGEVDPGLLDENGSDGKDDRIVLFSPATGLHLGELNFRECEEPTAGPFYFSSDGSLLGVALVGMTCNEDANWTGFAFYDTTDWTEQLHFDDVFVTMTEDMTQVLFSPLGGPAELLSFPDLELIETFDIELGGGGVRILSPDGATIVYRTSNSIDFRPGLWDVAANQHVAWGDGFSGFFIPPTSPDFTEDGLFLATSTESDFFYDVTSGQSPLQLPTKLTNAASIHSDGGLVATANYEFVNIWDIGTRSLGSRLDEEGGLIWLNSDLIDSGPRMTLLGATGGGRWEDPQSGRIAFPDETSLVVIEPSNGRVVAQRAAWDYDQMSDGRIALIGLEYGDPEDLGDNLWGPLLIWDPETNEEVVLQDCQVGVREFFALDTESAFKCADGTSFAGSSIGVSPDGTELAAVSWDTSGSGVGPEYEIRIWDIESGTKVREFGGSLDVGIDNTPTGMAHFGDGWLALIDGFPGSGNPTLVRIVDSETGQLVAKLQEQVEYRESFVVSPDERFVYLVSESGEVFEYETSNWQRTRSWAAMDGRPRGLSVSDDGRLFAASGEDELVSIWDISLTEPVLIDRIPVEGWASDTAFFGGDRLGAVLVREVGGRVEWRVIDIDQGSVIAAARSTLIRDFTLDECRTYGIERCDPTTSED